MAFKVLCKTSWVVLHDPVCPKTGPVLSRNVVRFVLSLIRFVLEHGPFCPWSFLSGNGSFRSYSRSDPGSFPSYSLSVRSFRPGSFRPDFRGGLFRPDFGGSAHFILCSF